MRILLASLLALAVLTLALPAIASDVAYLYGTVTTVDKDRYTGEIRWGTEEAFWDDIFNTTKIENPNIDYLDEDQLDDLEDDRRSWWSRTFVSYEDWDGPVHVFQVRFGDIRSIEILGDEEILVEFKDGSTQEFEGGSNDVGARITVVDPELGVVRLDWDRVRRVDFSATPKKLDEKLGDPLYGVVETRHGEFSGSIQWDHDEGLTTDILDGRSRDGKLEIEFGDIESIEREGNGSLVVLKSGRELELRDSNDVDDDNRGIVVKDPEIGKVKVAWDDFDRITFTSKPITSPAGYESYGTPREIRGRVETKDGDYRGTIVYDLDEAWDYELLNGHMDDTEFQIPFRLIARIEPQGRKRAVVELRNGTRLELEDSQDVTRRNTGILVFASRDEPDYIEWKEIEVVVFD